ncbi:hypothetical protein BAUCODRAFT_31194 [Baudoinia panamericana UAMH 10762]|uniref:Arrestin-like N-terminal domain-containing protein n=1 Tax=Baudoinia panamericana (strain UAMH 10762) TaxID=717646 RepID=M2NIJ9_BAUPA|nr:uncharacterized protein BAUCODRAFT_31194 [Baudoinia panamericana UAMH 10762]EMC98920.1 hypothetical protein BAUCODRAFT_31194 [Baudoinia panamericana UAMH 10762]
MNAAIVLDSGGHNIAFTNLDEISGKVILHCSKSVDIQSILVKLEGESRTRLLSPGGGPNDEKPTPQIEYHKILYRVQMAFPQTAVLESRTWSNSVKSSSTMPPGEHEFPFRFKIPFNNSCATDRSTMPSVSVSSIGLEVAKPASRHVKRTLPPTLSGFPGEAEIRYFVKATVARQSFFKGSVRAYTPFNFFPIEPPRPPMHGSEVFARQRHTFSAYAGGEVPKVKGKGIFGMKKGAPLPTASAPPTISIDVRLPEPAILTCNQAIPLRLIAKKLSSHAETVMLQSLQISLLGYTNVRAHGVHRTETNSWVIMSRSNLAIPIGLPTDAVDTETVLDDRMWNDQKLPNTVAPSFETCNISRTYQLDVRIGLSYAGTQQSGHKVRKDVIPRIPQNIALPLRLDCQVYSGITPPPQLLEAMAQAKANIRRPSLVADAASEKLKTDGRKPSTAANHVPPTPVDAETVRPSAPPELPARPGTVSAPESQQPPMYSDAPPSYEDAIASHLPPVDAPRPEYAPPPTTNDVMLRGDEKKGWVD